MKNLSYLVLLGGSLLLACTSSGLPTGSLDTIAPHEVKFKTLEALAETFNFTVDETGTYHNPELEKRNVEVSGTSPNNSLFKRSNWKYQCFKRPGGSKSLQWAGAYNYGSDQLKKMGHTCKLEPGHNCVICYCIAGASVQLCRGYGNRQIHVTNYQVGFRGNEIVKQLLGDLLGLLHCGSAGCNTEYCTYSGWAANSGLEAEWHVALEAASCPGA
ncbi:hypothetical protein ABW20_dc0107267 [Dactylellina cionopaga]|nr:hypothetical protein ABW20_dc0107267 [Dactylellina cionopaga]